MDLLDSRDRLDLDDHLLLDEEIDAVTFLGADAAIHERQLPLSLETEMAVGEFDGKVRFICRFEQSRPKLTVNGDR
jgi:hypothetical protein